MMQSQPQPLQPLEGGGEFMEREQVIKYLQISPATLYRWMRSRGFPRPLAPGARKRLWRRCEVEAWLEASRQVPPPPAA